MNIRNLQIVVMEDPDYAWSTSPYVLSINGRRVGGYLTAEDVVTNINAYVNDYVRTK